MYVSSRARAESLPFAERRVESFLDSFMVSGVDNNSSDLLNKDSWSGESDRLDGRMFLGMTESLVESSFSDAEEFPIAKSCFIAPSLTHSVIDVRYLAIFCCAEFVPLRVPWGQNSDATTSRV